MESIIILKCLEAINQRVYTGWLKSRPNNLSLVCLYLSLYIWHTVQKKKKKKKSPNNKKEIYDKYRHTRDRLFGLAKITIVQVCCYDQFRTPQNQSSA